MMDKLTAFWTEGVGDSYVSELSLRARRRSRMFTLPETREEWLRMRPGLRRRLAAAIRFSDAAEVPLEVVYLGDVRCEGYIVKKVMYRSAPDVWVTGALYIPQGTGPFPALMNMHGHWPQGHLAAKEQNRCHMLVRSGFVVLSVDTLGSGDRAESQGAYGQHGARLGGRLFVLGETLMGRQLMDNMRGVDLLCSLPFVDASRIGAFGASGGGNQTMYLAAFDERIKAAAPMVSVGSFMSYVGCENCTCEVIPDGLEISEEAGLLALVAPRSIKPFNGMYDTCQTFWVSEMMKTYTEAMKVFVAMGCPEQLDYCPMDCGHGVTDDAYRLLVAYFERQLKGNFMVKPRAIPPFTSIPEELMSCFEPGKRPDKVVGVQAYLAGRLETAAAKGEGERKDDFGGLVRRILKLRDGGVLSSCFNGKRRGWDCWTLETRRGHLLPVWFKKGTGNLRVLSAPRGIDEVQQSTMLSEALSSGDSVVVFELFGTGGNGTWKPNRGELNDFSRTLLWVGRRLLGEWTSDYLDVVSFARQTLLGGEACKVTLAGRRDAGLAALYGAYVSECAVGEVQMEHTIDSFADAVDERMTMAICIPDLALCGDVPALSSGAPCPVVRY